MGMDGGFGGPAPGGEGGGGGGGGGGDGGGGGGPDVSAGGGDQPAVHEGQLFQARAERAEVRAEELEGRIRDLEGELKLAREGAIAAERRGEMEKQLRDANAVDVETAMLLTEIAVMGMEKPDVSLAVRELRESKPFLFRGRKAREGGGSAMSASPGTRNGGVDLGVLADDARASGDRGALLRYLRGRRAL